MSEVFSIQLSNHTARRDGKSGVWLDLPATAEQAQAATGQISVTQDNLGTISFGMRGRSARMKAKVVTHNHPPGTPPSPEDLYA